MEEVSGRGQQRHRHHGRREDVQHRLVAHFQCQLWQGSHCLLADLGQSAGLVLAGDADPSLHHPWKPHAHFEAEVYVLSKEEGGRHTPFFKGYRPQFYFRTTDVTGTIELPEGMEMVMPGDNIQMTIELIIPIAMEESIRFAIREGGRTVGAGVVTKILA